MTNIIFPTDTTAVTVAVDDLLLVSDTSASWAAKEATALAISLCWINDSTTTTTNLWSADKINTFITAGYQPLDADLTALAALSGTNNIYYRSAANTWTSVTIGTGLSFSWGTLTNTISVTWTNTGDQTSIVWISGTMAQFDTACSNWDFVYQSWALWTPASWTLTNVTWLPIAWLVASTSTAIGVWSVELWHATDTTITRVSAGLIAVEGVTLVDVSTVQTLTNKTLTSPTLTTPALWTPASGNLSSCTADWTDQVWFRNIPQNSKSAAYTTVLSDAGKHIYHPGADTTARIRTIDSNANVAYPIGTAITFINDTSAWVITISITSDTMILAWAGTTGSRTLAANGIATAIKMTSTRRIISWTWLT